MPIRPPQPDAPAQDTTKPYLVVSYTYVASSNQPFFTTEIIFDRSDALVTLDGAGRIASWNRHARRMLGYDRKEVVGKSLLDLFATDLRTSSEIERQLKHIFASDSLASFETQLARKDGSVLDVLATLLVRRDERDRPRGAMCMLKNVTNRRGLPRSPEAEGGTAQFSELTRGFMHEMKNPLAGLKMGLELLKRKAMAQCDDYDWEVLSDMHQEVTAMERTIEGLIDFTRERPLRYANCNVATLLEHCARRSGHHPDISMTTEVTDGITSVALDEHQVQDALIELVANAVEAVQCPGNFSPARDRRIRLSASLGKRNAQDWLRLAVSDTGNGMSAEVRAKAFHPFFSTKSGRLGLGLSIVRQVVRAHGGDLWLESTQGIGTEVVLLLPLINVESPIAGDLDAGAP